MVIHYLHKVGCTNLTHSALAIVKLAHLTVKATPALLNGFEINHVIEIALYAGNFADNCLDLFVAENGAYAAAAGLLHPDLLAPAVIEGEVQHADERVVSCRAGGNNTYVLPVRLIIGEHFRELLGKHMTVNGFGRRLENLNIMVHAVDKNNDIIGGLALKFDGIKT
ncbi:MAG: hypothetical protein BWY89_01114 [Bacteroidetes bacterium ADurb.BinA012]|nr:MAG: hypothetical protein BWY89_01114 [Bacteroidetes bacterium ADurb.BinA012]